MKRTILFIAAIICCLIAVDANAGSTDITCPDTVTVYWPVGPLVLVEYQNIYINFAELNGSDSLPALENFVFEACQDYHTQITSTFCTHVDRAQGALENTQLRGESLARLIEYSNLLIEYLENVVAELDQLTCAIASKKVLLIAPNESLNPSPLEEAHQRQMHLARIAGYKI